MMCRMSQQGGAFEALGVYYRTARFMGNDARKAAIARFLRKLIETNSHLFIATFSTFPDMCKHTLKLVCDEKDSALWNDVQERIHCDEHTSGMTRNGCCVRDKGSHLDYILGQRDELRLTGKTLFCDDDPSNVDQSETVGFEIRPVPSAAVQPL